MTHAIIVEEERYLVSDEPGECLQGTEVGSYPVEPFNWTAPVMAELSLNSPITCLTSSALSAPTRKQRFYSILSSAE